MAEANGKSRRQLAATALLLALAALTGCVSQKAPADMEIGRPASGMPDPAAETRSWLAKGTVTRIVFQDDELGTVIDYLQSSARWLSKDYLCINFVVLPKRGENWRKRKISLRLEKVPLRDVVATLCRDIGYRYTVEKSTVILLHPSRKIVDPEVGKPKAGEPDPAQRLRKVMDKCVLSSCVCQYLSLGNLFSHLGVRTRELDPEGVGVTFIVKAGLWSQMNKAYLEDLPVSQIIRYIAFAGGLKITSIRDGVVTLTGERVAVKKEDWGLEVIDDPAP